MGSPEAASDYVSVIPAELEAENQRELLHLLRERRDTLDPAVQEMLQAWVERLEETGAVDVAVNLEQARLYAAAGLTDLAGDQLNGIFARIDYTAPEARTPEVRAIGNLAIDLENRILGNGNHH